jgi:hypothetical protein
MYFASFFLLATFWAQDRMIIIYYPLTLMFVLAGLYYIVKDMKKISLKWLYPLFAAVLLTTTFLHAKEKVSGNFPVLQQNILGNDLYGLTADWENFIKMSRWANDNLPKDAVIVSRKPSISYIYTGRNFQGIYNVPQETLDNVIQKYNSKNPDTVFFIMDISKGILPNLSPFLQYQISPRNESKYTVEGNESGFIGIYTVHKSLIDKELTGFLDSTKISYTTDFDGFIKQFQETDGTNYVIINPDMLYNILVDNNVRYLLLPRIRLYTSQNTGRYINTIHQFVSFINTKYPDSFLLIHTIGKEEICELAEFVPQRN